MKRSLFLLTFFMRFPRGLFFGHSILFRLTLLSHTPTLQLGSSTLPIKSSVKNLGVTFDNALSFKEHISKVCKTRLSLVRKHFDFKSFEMLIHVFITSRLDYCNSLLFGAPLLDIHQLQMV